jgi:hypothetical protein
MAGRVHHRANWVSCFALYAPRVSMLQAPDGVENGRAHR